MSEALNIPEGSVVDGVSLLPCQCSAIICFGMEFSVFGDDFFDFDCRVESEVEFWAQFCMHF